jgi:outer membrane receptor protein involved in Fe transport
MHLLWSAAAVAAALFVSDQASEVITVTATRTESRVADTPASVVVLSREVLDTTAAATIDDALRQVPGFTLFRRTGSRVANPTSQGVSMRGIGASGASRALVLDDGIPLNDPFGGWVYWGRVPRTAIDRVEVVRGGGSELYGSSAMGGVVQFIRSRPSRMDVTAEMSGGSMSTATGSAFATFAHDEWRGALAVDLFTTGGYTLVAPGQRGAVDVPADTGHSSFDATVSRGATFLRLSHFDEERNNGTPLQVNDTVIRQIAAGAETVFFGGNVQGRAWGSDQDYRQTFSAIAADRQTERLTVDQRVPSRSAGANMQWAKPLGRMHALLTGVEAKSVSGSSDELAGATRTRVDGTQRTISAFVEDIFLVRPNLSVTAGLRYDDVEDESSWSPRLAALYRRGTIGFTASAYRAFRAPTLNELHRSFRVGNILTLANPELTAERLEAIEVGVRGANVRATLFLMSMEDVVSNVTLSTTPALITRQRSNVAASRSRGAEVEGEWRIGRRLRVSSGYLFVDSAVTAGQLRGRRLPQVPRHQLTGQLLFSSAFTAALQTRWSSMQFDDDQNQLRLRGFFVADAFLSHPLGRGVDVLIAAENIFDRRIEASASPVITLGQPRAIRAGLRYKRQ